ncbi:hypothetical protein AAMO2058_001401100 [Amorphochlora amoebiformis]
MAPGRPANERPIILYLHGFEEHDGSPKPASLRDHYDLRMPHLSVYLTHRHSPIRYMATSPWLLGILCVSIIFSAALRRLGAYGVLGGLGALGVGLIIKKDKIIAHGIKTSLDNSMQTARLALERSKPDAVVAFSWGACLAVMLMQKGLWRGPTLLLAPAYELLCKKAQVPVVMKVGQAEGRASVMVVHSTTDQIVPLEHSERLAQANDFKLKKVKGEKHALYGLASNATLKKMVEEVLQSQ